MTPAQGLLFVLFAAILGLLAWGKYRYDLVSAAGLVIAVMLGLVPARDAFAGFSNEAVIIVALALVVSRAFENSGALGSLARLVAAGHRSVRGHIAVFASIGAALSTVMNNVAALAVLMPLDIEAARQAKRPAGPTLMPLAFATILGGIVTLIGTPPNLVASAIREERLGASYSLFDFTPVGIVVAVVGILFVALVGWRLVPRRADTAERLVAERSFRAHLAVPAASPLIGRQGIDLEQTAREGDVALLGAIRQGSFQSLRRRTLALEAGDVLAVEGSTDAIAAFMKTNLLQPKSTSTENGKASPGDTPPGQSDLPIVEAVVRADSPMIGTTAAQLVLRDRYDIMLLGVARRGVVRRTKLGKQPLEAGSVLLLSGRGAVNPSVLGLLGLVAINRTMIGAFQPRRAAITGAVFALAILAASFGWLSFPVALTGAVIVYAALGIVPAADFYAKIEWPIVVMLACLLPLGEAFDRTGGTLLIANAIAGMTVNPILCLTALMIATTLLSGVLNNVATIIIFGPVALDLAERINVNPDTFLMGVTIAASCAFLTPIGHKNNLLIMGPGGFRFADYWKLGLPLTGVVLVTAIPMLLWVWPL